MKKYCAGLSTAAILALTGLSLSACATKSDLKMKVHSLSHRIDVADAKATEANQKGDAANQKADAAMNAAQQAQASAQQANQRLDQLGARMDTLEQSHAKKKKPRG